MRLVIEKLKGEVFVYRETEKHFAKAEKMRGTLLIYPMALEADCNLSGRDDFHMVFRVKKPRKPRKKRRK